MDSESATDSTLLGLNLDLRAVHIDLINNGHTIEQEYHNGSELIYDGKVFELLQFHFHTYSEHTINGERFPLELHAVFQDMVTGNLAVIGQLFRIGPTNAFLAQFTQLPTHSGDHVSSTTNINLADALIDTDSYYTYPGLLTTPPCSEIVTWLVLAKASTVSHAQYQLFLDHMGNNFRPLQNRDPGFMTKTR